MQHINYYALGSKGMKISKTKTECTRCAWTEQDQDGQDSIRLEGLEVKRVDAFRCLAQTLSSDGNGKEKYQEEYKLSGEVGEVCQEWYVTRKMPIKLKGKVYKTVVRPAMMYRAEALRVKKINEKKLDVAKMRMDV